jgi:hypothetical protein
MTRSCGSRSTPPRSDETEKNGMKPDEAKYYKFVP